MKKYLLFCAFSSILFSIAGCGKSTGEVSGEISYHNKPIVFGTLTLVAAEDVRLQASIQADGKYAVQHVPYGKYRVEIVSTEPKALLPPAPKLPEKWAGKRELPRPPEAPGWFAIPEKYSSQETSGLTLDVNAGSVVFDIPLQD